MRSILRRVRRVTSGLGRSKWGESKEAGQGSVGLKGSRLLVVAGLVALGLGTWPTVQVFDAMADPLPGNPDPALALDPTTIPKYATPLVIPPVMKQSVKYSEEDKTDKYQIAVRQFKQQILPAPLGATTVWSYGPQSDPTPTVAPAANSQFNYPAYTIETRANRRVDVRWINGLVKPDGTFLPHLLPVDQTLHWANPPKDCVASPPATLGTGMVNHPGTAGTDCMGKSQDPYTGPVPIVTHVHGAHVDPHSDGYPEAWWLPAAKNLDFPVSYARSGRLFDDATGMNRGNKGYADFSYRNDQAATTLWYHDHSLGMPGPMSTRDLRGSGWFAVGPTTARSM